MTAASDWIWVPRTPRLRFLDWSSGQAKHPALATGADGLAAAKLVAAAYAQAQMPSTSTV